MAISAERAVREYLISRRNPKALRDEEKIAELRNRLESSDDDLERLSLRQQLLEAETPEDNGYEDRFVQNAKKWADKVGVSEQAFLAEGVPAKVLRKAGFRKVSAVRTPAKTSSGTRKRVSADEVRAAIPKGQFTIKDVQDRSGASAAVVRRIVGEQVEAGKVTEVGRDPEHSGSGRAPTVYSR